MKVINCIYCDRPTKNRESLRNEKVAVCERKKCQWYHFEDEEDWQFQKNASKKERDGNYDNWVLRSE